MEKKPHQKGSMPRVAALPWPGMDGAYLMVSGRERRTKLKYGERWYPEHQEHDERVWKWSDEFRSEPVVSFLFDAGNCCAEWDGSCGPIQLWWRASQGWKPDDGAFSEAREHWFYDCAYGAGHWSQMAVDEAGLPSAFNRGDFGAIFSELRRWAEARNGDYATAADGEVA